MLDLNIGVQVSLRTTQQCNREYWDNALVPSRKRPFPLAPPGIPMNKDFYEKSNLLLSEFVTKIMVDELRLMSSLPKFSETHRHIEILGVGLLRDLQWTPKAVRDFGFSMAFTDCSSVACDKVYAFIGRHKLFVNFDTVREMDAEEALFGFAGGQEEIDKLGTNIFYAGQFIQNQLPRTKDRFMRYFGSFLRLPAFGDLRRKIYLLHPLGERNPPEEVKWRKTMPYSTKKLITPIEKGYGGPVVVRELGVHKYCGHQTYSLLCFEGGD